MFARVMKSTEIWGTNHFRKIVKYMTQR